MGPYFIDFLCISERLAVEVDGPFHEERSDQRKTAWLEAEGYRVIRIPVTEVDESLDDVIHGIYLELASRPLPIGLPHPASPLRGLADLPASGEGFPAEWGGKAL